MPRPSPERGRRGLGLDLIAREPDDRRRGPIPCQNVLPGIDGDHAERKVLDYLVAETRLEVEGLLETEADQDRSE